MKKTLLTLIALFISTIAFAFDYVYNGSSSYNYATIRGGGCPSTLGEVIIPDVVYNYTRTYEVTKIISRVLYKCENVSSITIGKNISEIATQSFAGCSNLTSILVKEGNQYFTSIDGVLYNKDTTELICCPAGKTSISIPSSVTTIGSCAFEGCTALSSITIPSNVTTFGQCVFAGCLPSLIIIMKSTTPPSIIIDTWIFDDISKNATIKIPCGSISNYQNAKSWKDVANYIELPHEIFTKSNNDTLGSVLITKGHTCFDNICMIYAVANHNCEFIKWSDGNTENPRTITVSQDSTFIAEFIKETYYNVQLTINNGIISGGGIYKSGEKITLSVIPNEGYHFTQWSDGNTDNPRTIIITQDTTLTAICEINKYIISLSAENGVVIGAGEYMHGSEATLAAIPNNGYRFAQWSDGNTENPRYIIVTQDITLSAILSLINDPSVNIENSPNSNISIFTTGNTLHIDSITTNYQIHTTTGQLIYSGNATTLTLPRGIYLITIAGETQKIIL